MSSFCKATVEELLESRSGLQKVRVTRHDGGVGNNAYVLTDLIGEVSVGEDVIVNTTAVDANLGTGGWHFVHWNLAHDKVVIPSRGNEMKLRYTSLQIDCGVAEATQEIDANLDGIPVIACMLLSQAATAIMAYKYLRPNDTIAVVVTDQAALPLPISDVLHELCKRDLVSFTISAGQAFGGTFESINVASGLALANAKGANAIFVTQGPGVIGSGTQLGFGPLEMAGVLDTALRMKAIPVLALRYSDTDARVRHRGISHHCETVLANCMHAIVPVPLGEPVRQWSDHGAMGVAVPDIAELFSKMEMTITSMGRSREDDPKFFAYAAAAGIAAAGLRASVNHQPNQE